MSDYNLLDVEILEEITFLQKEKSNLMNKINNIETEIIGYKEELRRRKLELERKTVIYDEEI